MSARSGVRVDPHGEGAASVETGVPVLDALVEKLAEYAAFDLTLEVEPGTAEVEVAEAGSAIGRALAAPLRATGARGHGSGVMASAEALATVVLEVSDAPLLVSNVDLTQARLGGLGSDMVRRFLERFADGAGITLHVRLLNGTDTQHVLDAIFKALGVALAAACAERSS